LFSFYAMLAYEYARFTRRDAGSGLEKNILRQREKKEQKGRNNSKENESTISAQNTMESNFLYLKIKHRSFSLVYCFVACFAISSIVNLLSVCLSTFAFEVSSLSGFVCRVRSNESDF
jgi:hypothetical protein